MRTRTLLAALSLALPASLAAPAHAQSASTLWARNCTSCHAETGEGGGAGTQTLLTDELFDHRLNRRFFDAIKNGVPETAMPAYGETLSDAQIWSLVVHLRELQRDERDDRLGNPRPGPDGAIASRHGRYRVETVAGRDAKLGRVPWSIGFLPDGRILVTERGGALRVVTPGKGGAAPAVSEPVEGTPAVRSRGQGGMMEVAPHPDFDRSGWVYLSFTDPGQGGRTGMTKVVRGRIPGLTTPVAPLRWTEQQTIFEVRPEHYQSGDIHFGCKIVFDPPAYAAPKGDKPAGEPAKRLVYFALGERGQGALAQDVNRPNGKLFRVYDDGTVPGDNPFKNSDYPQIWSYGHRNPQGLVIDLDGRLWDTEHGPRGGDELNLIMKGRNYGWPIVSFGINYSDAPLKTPWPENPVSPAGKGPQDGLVMPAYVWLPSIAASGLDVVRGDAFPHWKGDLVAGGLAGQTVERLRMRVNTETGEAEPVEREEIFGGQGRVRDVRVGPDGSVYIAVEAMGRGSGQIVRLAPVKSEAATEAPKP